MVVHVYQGVLMQTQRRRRRRTAKVGHNTVCTENPLFVLASKTVKKFREKERMKLFTHNLLVCNKKGVKDGYPLKIEAKKVDIVKTEFNQEFIKGILTKIITTR